MPPQRQGSSAWTQSPPTSSTYGCTQRWRSFPLTSLPRRKESLSVCKAQCSSVAWFPVWICLPVTLLLPWLLLSIINVCNSLIFQENIFPQPCLWSYLSHPWGLFSPPHILTVYPLVKTTHCHHLQFWLLLLLPHGWWPLMLTVQTQWTSPSIFYSHLSKRAGGLPKWPLEGDCWFSLLMFFFREPRLSDKDIFHLPNCIFLLRYLKKQSQAFWKKM